MKKFLIGFASALLLLGLVAAAKSDFALGRGMEIVVNVLREINLLYVSPTDPDELVEAAAAGMTARLDPYTEFLPEERMEAFEVATTGKYGGVGALIRHDGEWVVVAEPYRGFPADEAGLQVGDRIVEIEGKEAQGMTTSSVSELLRGDPGSSVRLVVEKFYTGQREELRLKRRRIAISGVPYYGMAGEGIGYIRHDDFTEGCADDLRKALQELQKESPRGLILDLRGNGGGILQEAVKILGLFLPDGTEVVSMRGRVKEMDGVFRTSGAPVAPSLPMVVLVDGSSASASEIVAGALQDLDRAVLVGERTFGKGLVQSTRPVGYNAYLKLTTAHYYIPSGRSIQAIDYTRGSVAHLPDSLRKAFTTAAGRVVYDGGGITPEITLDPDYPGALVAEIYARGYIEQFVDSYLRPRPELSVPLMEFRLSQEAFEDFVAFMATRPLDYRSHTREQLDALRQTARQEQTLSLFEAELDRIEAQLPEQLDAALALHRADLERLITDQIIMRRHYADGVIRHNLPDDPAVVCAVALLADTARYARLLTP